MGRAGDPQLIRRQTIDVIPGTDSARSLIDYLWHWESTSPDRPFASDSTGASYSYAQTAAAVRALSAEFG